MKNPPASRMKNRIQSGKDKSQDLKKQLSNRNVVSTANSAQSRGSDKLVSNVLNKNNLNNLQNPEKNIVKSTEVSKNIQKEYVSKYDNITTSNSEVSNISTEANCVGDINLLKKKESDLKDLKDIKNFILNKKENKYICLKLIY